jgi:DNA-binding PadR family transcriptional regulator
LTVRHAILGLLAQRPRHGYDLHAAFEALAGGADVWGVQPAQIYTTLTRLQDLGLVRQQRAGSQDKRIYALTPKGRAELNEWFASGVAGEHQRDEFFVKLMLSIEDDKADPYQVIQAQRSELYKRMHAWTTRRSHVDPKSELAQIFLLDKMIMHLEADLKWLDLLEGRLDDIRKQPLPKPELRGRGRPRKETHEEK